MKELIKEYVNGALENLFDNMQEDIFVGTKAEGIELDSKDYDKIAEMEKTVAEMFIEIIESK